MQFDGKCAGRFAVLAAWAALCSGCANSLLYNEARDKQGQAAKQAAAEVNLVAVVEAQQARFKALSALEIETQKGRRAVSRDFAIARLARSVPDKAEADIAANAGIALPDSVGGRYVDKLIEPRIQALTGRPITPEELKGYFGEVAAQGARRQLVQAKLRTLSVTANRSFDNCKTAAAFAEESPPDHVMVKAALSTALQVCKADSPPSIPHAIGGDLRALADALQLDRKRAGDHRQKLASYKEALTRAEQAAAAESPGKPAGERLQAGARKLENAIAPLSAAATGGDSRPFAHALAQLRFEALDRVLKALSSGATDLSQLSEDERSSVLVLRLIPSLSDEAKRWEQEASRIRLAPLVLAKENQRLVVEGFNSQLAVLDRIVALREKALASARAEFAALAEARQRLDAKGITLDQPLAPLLDGGDKTARYQLYLSLAAYFDRAEQHRLDREIAELEIDAAFADEALVASRSAAEQWQNLTTSIAAVLGDYHASGVRTAEIAEFLKAFGLIHIGNNVGK